MTQRTLIYIAMILGLLGGGVCEMNRGCDNRVLITYIIMAGLLLGAFIAGNVAWQHWCCGTPLTECRMFADCPCEPIDKLSAEKAEFERLAVENPYHYVGTKTSH